MKFSVKLISAFFALSISEASIAGPYTDSFGRCLASNITAPEKAVLVKWVYSSVSQNPEVKELSLITPEKKQKIATDMGALFTSLVSDRCKSQAEDALNKEGTQPFEKGFLIIVDIAIKTMLSNQSVSQDISQLPNHVDKAKFESSFSK